MNTTMIMPEVNQLESLSNQANSEHSEVIQCGVARLEHAIKCGEHLLDAQAIVSTQEGQGRWQRWIAENFDGGLSTTANYMRLARHQERLRAAGVSGIGDALRYLRLTHADSAGRRGHPEWLRDEVCRIVMDEHRSYNSIAQEFGIGRGTIRRWVDPDIRQTDNQRASARMAARRTAKTERKTKLAARKAGVARAEAYAMAERFQDVIAQAQREGGSQEEKASWSRAAVHHRAMRDEIVKALGLS